MFKEILEMKAKKAVPVLDSVEQQEKTWKDLCDAQKPIHKLQALKLLPGTWIELKWVDSPNSVALLTQKLERETGDVNLHCFFPDDKENCFYANSSQIVRIIGPVVIPKLKK
jgi:hypothetical protein